MEIKKYFNFEYITKGFYSIAKGMSTFNLFTSRKNYKEFTRKEGDLIEKNKRDFCKDKQKIKEDWKKICKDLGSVVWNEEVSNKKSLNRNSF